MESKSVKTVAMFLVGGVILYALYQIFEGNSIFGGISTPGSVTSNLGSIPGVPGYSVTAPTSATPQAVASEASSLFSEFSPAFGGDTNTPDSTGDDEISTLSDDGSYDFD
jgi:hypothetical protein